MPMKPLLLALISTVLTCATATGCSKDSQPAPVPVAPQSPPPAEKVRPLPLSPKEQFEATFASGHKQWKPSQVSLIVKETDIKRDKTKTVNNTCTLETPIELKGEFPVLHFSMGILECDKLDSVETGRRLAFTQMISNLKYKIRKPDDSGDNQFKLILSERPSFYVPTIFQVENVQSMNANITDQKILLDVIGETRSTQMGAFVEREPTYFLELELIPSQNGYESLKITLEVSSQIRTTRFELNADLGAPL